MAGHSTSVRPPAVAGQFYPEGATELRAQVEDLLARAPDLEADDRVLGLVVPHAGYSYSGQTAAGGFRQVRGGAYDAVLVLAPSHREACGEAAVFSGEGYETPLGVVPVHRDLARGIAGRSDSASLTEAGHRVVQDPFSPLKGEHAIEVQLPFLQVVLPDVPVVPIVMGACGMAGCTATADAIAAASEGLRVLLVASSDLYHGPSLEACMASDERTLAHIVSLSPAGFWEGVQDGRFQACGSRPILTLQLAAQRMGATRACLVSRTTSADASGSAGNYVVGYGSVLVLGGGSRDAARGADLGAGERAALGRTAREAVRAAARGERPAPLPEGPAALEQPGMAFVTLMLEGRLRGCIGNLQGAEPLGLVVQRMAAAAAVGDPRFPPLTPAELDGLEIEISVIGSFRTVAGPEEIRIGRDGLWVRLGARQGVLLPKVAEEYGWTPAEFLSHTCRKAQLPPDAWQDPDAHVQAFTAQVFTT